MRSKEEDPEKQKERQQTVKGKSVAELSAITSLSEFPVPKPSIFDSAKRNKSKERSRYNTKWEKDSEMILTWCYIRPLNRSTTPTSGSGKKDTIYEKLPGSLKSEVLVRAKDSDPEKTKERQELIRSKSPHELSQITSFAEFPVPSPIQNLFGGRY